MTKQDHLYSVLLAPHLSEKAAIVGEKNNEYVFKVALDSTKSLIKDAVEYLFNVRVKKVTVVRRKPKEKRFKGQVGHTKEFKKAYVTLHTDQKLDILGNH